MRPNTCGKSSRHVENYPEHFLEHLADRSKRETKDWQNRGWGARRSFVHEVLLGDIFLRGEVFLISEIFQNIGLDTFLYLGMLRYYSHKGAV